jgi:hypothetical protein
MPQFTPAAPSGATSLAFPIKRWISPFPVSTRSTCCLLIRGRRLVARRTLVWARLWLGLDSFSLVRRRFRRILTRLGNHGGLRTVIDRICVWRLLRTLCGL